MYEYRLKVYTTNYAAYNVECPEIIKPHENI